MTEPSTTGRRRSPVGPWLLAAPATAAHLVVGYFSAVSGLAVPVFLLAPVWLLWVAGAFRLQDMVARRSWWTPAVPAVTAAALVLAALTGDALGYTA